MTRSELIDLIKLDRSIIGYVYLITNMSNNKIYVGQSRKINANDISNYFGSGRIIRKVDKADCMKEILATANSPELLNSLEQHFIHEFNACDRLIGYNLSRTVNYFNISNISGQKNPASKTNMNEEQRKLKGLKAAITRSTTIAVNGKTIQENALNRRSVTMQQKNNDLSFAHIAAKKSHDTQRLRGTDKLRIARMIKTKKATNSFIIGAQKAAKTIKENGLLKGGNNPKAQKWILISPNGETFEIFGTLKEFATAHNIQIRLLQEFLNRGKIYLKSKNFSSQKSFNTQGWEIRNDKYVP